MLRHTERSSMPTVETVINDTAARHKKDIQYDKKDFQYDLQFRYHGIKNSYDYN